MSRKIESVAIIGAGALGLLYGQSIKKILGEKLYFLSDQDRYGKIKSTTYLINDKPEFFNAKIPEELEEYPDLIIIAVKNHHLKTILPILEKAIRKHTIIISVLNGIDSEELLESYFPQASIIYTVALGMDAVKEGDELTFTSRGKLLLGRKNNDSDDPVLKAVFDFLSATEIKIEIPEDIIRSLWWKWMINIGVNQVSSVTGAQYKVFQENDETRELMDSAMLETVMVAKAAGVDLTEEDISEWYPILDSLGPEGKTSMLQDMEAQRISEAPYFGGKLISLGEKYGVPVPVNETLYRIIRTKEALFTSEEPSS
ncbi:MAG: ketopantoate reductase family protein [Spirochaetales bacterium]|nr:ketopantoate reductase family protein [Spirochaetales bacterium]